MPDETYCIDTSSLIFAYNQLRPSTFKNLWERIKNMFEEKIIYIPEEVLEELSVQTDAAYIFFKANSKWVVPLDARQINAARILINKYPNMVNVHTSKNSADPFVVALAQIRRSVVITQETVKNEQQLKLPNLCKWHSVESIDFQEFLARQEWDL